MNGFLFALKIPNYGLSIVTVLARKQLLIETYICSCSCANNDLSSFSWNTGKKKQP